MKKQLMTMGTTIAMAGIFLAGETTASAQESWTPRSVEEIRSEIQEQEAKGSKYTFQWGDTLSGLAAATDLSVDKLVKVNDINHKDMIFAGNNIHLSADNSVVTVEDSDNEVKSYDVSEEEVVEVETPEEVKQELQEKEVVEEKPEEKVETTVETQPVEKAEAAATTSQAGRKLVVEATAYSTNQPSLGTITYSGINLLENPRVIAVDPSVIPLGSQVHIPGYGTYIAGDTGSAIKGNRIDVHITDLNDAIAFGRRSMEITILN